MFSPSIDLGAQTSLHLTLEHVHDAELDHKKIPETGYLVWPFYKTEELDLVQKIPC